MLQATRWWTASSLAPAGEFPQRSIHSSSWCSAAKIVKEGLKGGESFKNGMYTVAFPMPARALYMMLLPQASFEWLCLLLLTGDSSAAGCANRSTFTTRSSVIFQFERFPATSNGTVLLAQQPWRAQLRSEQDAAQIHHWAIASTPTFSKTGFGGACGMNCRFSGGTCQKRDMSSTPILWPERLLHSACTIVPYKCIVYRMMTIIMIYTVCIFQMFEC